MAAALTLALTLTPTLTLTLTLTLPLPLPLPLILPLILGLGAHARLGGQLIAPGPPRLLQQVHEALRLGLGF